MDTLQNMKVFVHVVEATGFTAAAQKMNTTTASASRAVSDLEAHLCTRLLNRTTRRIALTEAGQRYLQRCLQILAYVEQAEAEASDAHARPSGRLRVHATSSFGQYYVAPAITRYRERYPSVSIDLTLSQHVPDLLDEGYDVTLQLAATELPDSGLVSQRLGSSYSVLCASPAYLEKSGTPRTVADLAEHMCLHVVTSIFPRDRWTLEGPDGVETFELPPPQFRVNVADALAVALRDGMGIGALPAPTALPGLRNGTLVRVLPQHKMQMLTIYALYASRQYLDAKIKTWVEFLRESVPQTLAADEVALQTFSAR
jgi:DNA-binding transcriptional LysR family regulator